MPHPKYTLFLAVCAHIARPEPIKGNVSCGSIAPPASPYDPVASYQPAAVTLLRATVFT